MCIPARHSPSTPVSYGRLPKVFESLTKVQSLKAESLSKVSPKTLSTLKRLFFKLIVIVIVIVIVIAIVICLSVCNYKW